MGYEQCREEAIKGKKKDEQRSKSMREREGGKNVTLMQKTRKKQDRVRRRRRTKRSRAKTRVNTKNNALFYVPTTSNQPVVFFGPFVFSLLFTPHSLQPHLLNVVVIIPMPNAWTD
jgi:hypothetical protein